MTHLLAIVRSVRRETAPQLDAFVDGSNVSPPADSLPVPVAKLAPKASVFIFRPIRPRRYVDRMARIVISAKTADLGEKLLGRDMRLILQDLITAGADPVLVKREVRGLEAAIRARIWELVLTPRGGEG